jgi:hypothetical protein
MHPDVEAKPAAVPDVPPKAIRWFFPDLAMIAAVIYFFLFFAVGGPQDIYRDSDSGWHIRIGESILRNGDLPRTDPYSFSRPNHPWFAWEWGADVLMGAAHRLDGLRGVTLLYAVAIAMSMWLWVRLHWAVGGNLLIAFAMAGPLFFATSLHWLARPHVLSWLLFLGLLLYFEKAPERFRVRDGTILLAGSALWVNIHASFFLAVAIALIYAAGHLARPLIWELDTRLEVRKGCWFLYAALFVVLGSLVNPYAWKLHLHLLGFLGNRELLSRVVEWQSLNFHDPAAWPILLIMVLAALGGIAALPQKKLGHFLLSGMVLVMALRSARAIPLAGLMLLPLANGAITQVLRSYGEFRPALRRLVDRFLAYCDGLRTLDRRLSGVALAPLVVLLGHLWMRIPVVAERIGFPADQFPIAASSVIARLPENIRLLAPDMFGGYLVYRFEGKRKVYFDGRADFYGSEFLKRYLDMVRLGPGWQDHVERMRFTHALLPTDWALIEGLERLGWRRIYRDNVATLLEKP